ncbi:MAG: hypothetical protein H6728_15490 [Myxococcales bacterium]|nr:hypothetical protein [Myxococcales bacterium]
MLTPSGKLQTLFRDPRVIWADCVHIAKDGKIYMMDSGIPSYLDPLMRPPTQQTLKKAAPFRIFVLPALPQTSPKTQKP